MGPRQLVPLTHPNSFPHISHKEKVISKMVPVAPILMLFTGLGVGTLFGWAFREAQEPTKEDEQEYEQFKLFKDKYQKEIWGNVKRKP